MRVLAWAAGGLALLLIATTQVPSHVRLPVSAVVPGARVTQPFGCTTFELEPFDPRCPTRHLHTGIDLAAALGSDVFSATAGTAFVGYDPDGAGKFVKVVVDAHVRILYGHLSAFRVGQGDAVSPGQLIGLVGATGLATGPHVHLQVNVDRFPVDPAWFLAS
ncbi:MAG TPA: M23 family metallopeptidase [Candidatus Dormibacteraeota bacterium]|jgi:murein DD-endopeptidase MepM/ murein hydrolase activator NlpD|nr:M23 family metallopeptidase [Candidatus Dormibacteraeota bacterium]